MKSQLNKRPMSAVKGYKRSFITVTYKLNFILLPQIIATINNYGTAHFKLDETHMHHVLDWKSFSFHSCICMCVCACETDDVEALVQSTHVHTRHVHDILHEHASMSVMYTSNLTSLYAH